MQSIFDLCYQLWAFLNVVNHPWAGKLLYVCTQVAKYCNKGLNAWSFDEFCKPIFKTFLLFLLWFTVWLVLLGNRNLLSTFNLTHFFGLPDGKSFLSVVPILPWYYYTMYEYYSANSCKYNIIQSNCRILICGICGNW